MGDILKYRIPNQGIKEKSGNFTSVNSFAEKTGFIVSSFNKNEKFLFVESSINSKNLHYSSNVPICITQKDYNKAATFFLRSIKSQNLSKAIFSRVKKTTLNIDLDKLINRLCEAYPNAFVYCISSPLFGTWIGASPETLIESKGKKASTMALAGTIDAKSNDQWSSKEMAEQEYVSDYILNVLKSKNAEDIEVTNLKEVIAGPVKHLQTSYTFQLGNNKAVEIAEALHPTPAISGFPVEESLQLISSSETHQRKLYAGIIGLIGKTSTELFVNLRCAEIINNEAFLYLGGGFTKDSIVEAEWQETENKAKTLLNVMQKND